MLVSSPVVIEPPTIRRAPNHEMSSMHAYIQNCISGITPAMVFCALENVRYSMPETPSNFSVSWSSRT